MARITGQGSNWIRREKRFAIYMRDGMACVYCGDDCEGSVLTLDHLIAGGSNKPTNLVTCCNSCNSAKQDRSLEKWLRILAKRGFKVATIAARIIRLTARPIDRDAAKSLLRRRKAAA